MEINVPFFRESRFRQKWNHIFAKALAFILPPGGRVPYFSRGSLALGTAGGRRAFEAGRGSLPQAP